ncbi:hypothetical protein [Marinivivus vitaminiproducens]|uniref:hypothetical protein n=1 Tax=Marinivivus vitaminiproducens TaxID=3035935 RepID=UPI002798BA4D|nr:hypothetical protein P4R82_05230 [Geminicoccaceae bacterium SCSIO 64248]
MQNAPSSRLASSSGTRFVPATLLACLFVAITLPPVLAGLGGNFVAGDMATFHLPQINLFIGSPFAVFDYEATSATTPGYHWLLALFARLSGYAEVDAATLPLRLANLAVGLAVVLGFWAILQRLSGDGWRAAVLTVPLLASSYVLNAAIWVVTDNAALLGYVLMLAALLFQPDRPGRAALAGLLAVASRQIYLPIVAAIALPLMVERWTTWGVGRRMLAIALPVAPVLAWAIAWQGLTPPRFQDFNAAQFNPAVPLHALALTGLFACVYAPFAWRFVRSEGYARAAALAIGAAVLALALWLIVPTAYSDQDGRWGSLVWLFAKLLPAPGGHAPLVLPLIAGGLAALAVMAWHAWRRRYLPVELAMLLLYFAGYAFQPLAWQRYIEPVILITMGVFVARLDAPRWALLGPAVTALLFGMLALGRIWGWVPRLFG